MQAGIMPNDQERWCFLRLRDHVKENVSARLINTFISYDIWTPGKGFSKECPSLLGASRWRNDDLVRHKAITDHISRHIPRVRSAALCEPSLAIVLAVFHALSLGMAEQHQTQHCIFP